MIIVDGIGGMEDGLSGKSGKGKINGSRKEQSAMEIGGRGWLL